MVQLVCPCLNVRVHGKGNTLELRDACSLNLPEIALQDNFFSSQVYDVLLDLGGVTKAQKSLCSSRCVDGWVITFCIGCETDVYAKHLDDNDRVLVSCNIEKDPNRITSLMESEHYSSLFKLLLPDINDNFVQNNFGADFGSSKDSLEHAIKNVQHQVSGYLREEQKAMEERIRAFSEQQQSRYSALQQKVRRHKQAMVYLLLKRKELKSSLNNSLVESVSPSSPLASINNSCDESSSSSDSAHHQDTSSNFIMETTVKVQEKPHPRRNLRRMHSVNNPPRRPKQAWTLKQVSHSIDVGGVFDMEGFETIENSRPFYNSDDDTDGSSLEDNVPQKKEEQQKQQQQQYSGSLPISVPAWSNYSRYSIYEDEEEQVQPHKDPEQLASSFLALAQSVQDGTEIFGALPRRRLNTGELLKSRPI